MGAARKAAAAGQWSVPIDSISTRDSVVTHGASGRQLRYGELAEAGRRLSVPSRPRLKPREQHRLMGQSVLRPDIPPKVAGSFTYGIDVKQPDMRYAATKAAPVHGGKLICVNAAPALDINGVETVMELHDSVAVIAQEPWQALQAVGALDPRSSAGSAADVSTDGLYAEQLIALDRAEREQQLKIGSAKKTLAAAERRIESVYRAPFLHHAQLEPINATAQCPQATTRITATLGADGLPLAWSEVFTEGRPGRSIAYPIPYEIPHQLFEQVRVPHPIRVGSLRSVNGTQHGFWRESFIDELAHAARQDPLHYRLALTKGNARAQRVLREVAERSDWTRPLPPGVGRGVALHIEYESVIAQVVEASWEATGVKVHRVVAVVDCGDLVHPDTAAEQVEGAIIMGLSNAVAEEITIAAGAVVEKLFCDYRIFTLADVPGIEVHFLDSGAPRGGLGELGVPPAAPALANALFAATGIRARRTPLNAALREVRDLAAGALAAF